MFIDASVIVAIVSEEQGWDQLVPKLAGPRASLASPLSVWEATIALGRSGRLLSFEAAEDEVEAFVDRFSVRIIPITPEIGTPEIGTPEIEASRLYGRGRHKADLNFGDCFAYACCAFAPGAAALQGRRFRAHRHRSGLNLLIRACPEVALPVFPPPAACSTRFGPL